MRVAAGSVDQSVVIRIVDDVAGTPEEGVTSASGGLALWYWRMGSTVTALTESDLAALNSAHSDGGMKHADDGYYRVDIPDAAFVTGADRVTIGGTVTGMVVIGTVVEIGPVVTSALDAAGVRSAVGLASANLDTQLGDLPTNADLANSQAAADDTTLSAISMVEGKINTVESVVNAIKLKTDNLPADPADDSDIDGQLSAIAIFIDTEINTLVSGVAAILAATGTNGVVISQATREAIADAILLRSVTNTQDDAARNNLTQVVLAMFESEIDLDGVVTIRKTTGATYETKAATLDADAVPITGIT